MIMESILDKIKRAITKIDKFLNPEKYREIESYKIYEECIKNAVDNYKIKMMLEKERLEYNDEIYN